MPTEEQDRGFLTRVQDAESDGTVRAKTDDLAHGMYYADADFRVAESVAEVASNRGVPMAQSVARFIPAFSPSARCR